MAEISRNNHRVLNERISRPFLKKTCAFTLLEMMIALFILGLAASLIATQTKKLIDFHRFESEISHLFITLQEAQVLSSAYQTDISLDFYRKGGKLCYRFSTNEPFTKYQLDQKEKNLTNIYKIQFNDQKFKELHFDIFSGRLEPRGILAFFQTQEDDGKRLWFDLQYGQLLKFSYQKPTLAKHQIPSLK